MATTLTASFTLNGQGSFTNPSTGNITIPVDRFQLGQGSFTAPASWSITNGTGAGQCDLWWHSQRTIAGTTFDNLTLSNLPQNPDNPVAGAAVVFAHIKFILLALLTPTAGNSVRIGPQNQTHGWQGPWGGTGATVYNTVTDTFWMINLTTDTLGAVTAGVTDVLGVYNASAGSISWNIFIGGTST